MKKKPRRLNVGGQQIDARRRVERERAAHKGWKTRLAREAAEEYTRENLIHEIESATYLDYTYRWHEIYEWAHDLGIAPRSGEVSSDSPRVARVRWEFVRDLDDDREAARRGIPLGVLPAIHRGGGLGGTRRVHILAMTWTVRRKRDESVVAGDPMWMTLGTGMSVAEAVEAFESSVDGYATAQIAGVESRELVVTAIEVAWWTTGPDQEYM